MARLTSGTRYEGERAGRRCSQKVARCHRRFGRRCGLQRLKEALRRLADKRHEIVAELTFEHWEQDTLGLHRSSEPPRMHQLCGLWCVRICIVNAGTCVRIVIRKCWQGVPSVDWYHLIHVECVIGRACVRVQCVHAMCPKFPKRTPSPLQRLPSPSPSPAPPGPGGTASGKT